MPFEHILGGQHECASPSFISPCGADVSPVNLDFRDDIMIVPSDQLGLRPEGCLPLLNCKAAD